MARAEPTGRALAEQGWVLAEGRYSAACEVSGDPFDDAALAALDAATLRLTDTFPGMAFLAGGVVVEVGEKTRGMANPWTERDHERWLTALRERVARS
ncbi:MAG TPA: hypothetical protein VH561_16845 [Micromonosporaceae bacterium]